MSEVTWKSIFCGHKLLPAIDRWLIQKYAFELIDTLHDRPPTAKTKRKRQTGPLPLGLKEAPNGAPAARSKRSAKFTRTMKREERMRTDSNKATYWRRHIYDFMISGPSQAVYYRKHHLKTTAFNLRGQRWRQGNFCQNTRYCGGLSWLVVIAHYKKASIIFASIFTSE